MSGQDDFWAGGRAGVEASSGRMTKQPARGDGSPAAPSRSGDVTEHVSFECGFCGRKVGCYIRRYEKARCVCGKYHWALRPDEDGPLVMFPHPGPQPGEVAA